MKVGNAAETLTFKDAAEFEAWLAEHYDLQTGIWMKIAKKNSGVVTVANDDAEDVALCYGWITGKRMALDAQYFLQKYVPRRAKSAWSRINIRRVEALIAAGRMRAPGFAAIAAAKADGRWYVNA